MTFRTEANNGTTCAQMFRLNLVGFKERVMFQRTSNKPHRHEDQKIVLAKSVTTMAGIRRFPLLKGIHEGQLVTPVANSRAEACAYAIGLVTLVQRRHERVPKTCGSSNCEKGVKAPKQRPVDQHFTKPWMDCQSSQSSAEGGEILELVDGTKLL